MRADTNAKFASHLSVNFVFEAYQSSIDSPPNFQYEHIIMAKKSQSQSQKQPQEVAKAPVDQTARKKFEQRFEFFMNEFRAACNKAKAPVAVAVVIDPQSPDTPLFYSHGHLYDQTRLIGQVYRKLRQEIDQELGG
jgi:hypothetical protein